MSASELLAELRECGVELVATEGQLRYRPREAITPQLLDQIKKHKPSLMWLLESEQYRLQGVNYYSEDSHPEVSSLKAVGWKPKERCGKTIWQSPENDFWYSLDMAIHLQAPGQIVDPGFWPRSFALFNPHATIRFRSGEGRYVETGGWE
jgi:hypothetical protein